MWTFHKELTLRVLLQGLLYISLGCAGLSAISIRQPTAKTHLWSEAAVALYLTLLYTGLTAIFIKIATDVLEIAGTSNSETFLPSTGKVFLLVITALGYFCARVAVFIVLFWNRLRRRRLLWSLTNAHLIVVLLALALFIGRGAWSLLTSTRFFDLVVAQQADLTLSSAARLLIGLLLGLSLIGTFAFIAVIIVIPPSALFSFLVMRTTIRRLRTLIDAMQAVRAKNYKVRIAVQGEDEVANLQADFNVMTAALEQAITDLQVERDTVTQLLQARRALIASVSHELRTPITTLRATLESSIEHRSAPTLYELNAMRQDVLHLQTMVDDLFALSRAEVGQLTLRCQPTDVGPILTRIVESTVSFAWQSYRIELIAEISPQLPLAQVDEGRVEQIIRNLLHNSLRHTPSGGVITLSATCEQQYIQLEVWDTGEGISADALPHIWDRFYKVETKTYPDERRLGLGLAIVKELTEAMQGSVEAESSLGAGSRFMIRLPLATPVRHT
jgi:signal transduction histidine kinase